MICVRLAYEIGKDDRVGIPHVNSDDEEAMVNEFLKNNKVTVIEPSMSGDPMQTGQKRREI